MRGKLKFGGSIVAAAVGAFSAGWWARDEASTGPAPDKPKLSDPDSLALYSLDLDDPKDERGDTDPSAKAATVDEGGTGNVPQLAPTTRHRGVSISTPSSPGGNNEARRAADYTAAEFMASAVPAASDPALERPAGAVVRVAKLDKASQKGAARTTISLATSPALQLAAPLIALPSQPVTTSSTSTIGTAAQAPPPLIAMSALDETRLPRIAPTPANTAQIDSLVRTPSELSQVTQSGSSASFATQVVASIGPQSAPAQSFTTSPDQPPTSNPIASATREVPPLKASGLGFELYTTTKAEPSIVGDAGDVPKPLPQPTAAAPSTDTSDASTSASGNIELLALAPIVNGTAAQDVIAVERGADGGFRMRAEDLRKLRVKLDPAIGAQETLSLSSLGLTARYLESSQSLDLGVPDSLLVPTEIDARGGRPPIDVRRIASTPGLILNYRTFASIQNGERRNVRLSGDLEAVGTVGNSLFATNGFFGGRANRADFVRGDSFYRYEDPVRVRTLTIGDLRSGAVGFSRSVRLGGVQLQSAFRQRPDLYIGPLPQFAGSAALPSSLDLFADSVRVFSTKVPQGPFVLKSLPQISGNELRIVTKDANGRQTVIETPYFDAPGLIRRGLLEYSAELGAPRLDAGLRSFGYRSQLFGSGSMRYGLGDRTTVEAHAEGGGKLFNGGLGVIQALGPLGSLTVSGSGSTLKGTAGARLSGEYRFDGPRLSIFVSVERNLGRYFDLGDIATPRRLVAGQAAAGGQKRAVERAGFSYRPPFDTGSINFTYTRFRVGNTEFRNANIGLRRSISEHISFRGDGVLDLRRGGGMAVLLGLDVRLGRDARAFVGADRTNGKNNYTISTTGFSGGRQNALGWSFSQRGDDEGFAARSATLDYRLPQAFLAGSIEQSGNAVRGTAQVEGSIVAAGGGFFAANRIGEGFAIVQNAGPGVAILQSGRKIATANARGRALLSSLEAFSETRVALDAATLPPGLEAEKGTDFSVVTGRRRAAVVDFGVRKINAAIVVLFGLDGKPLVPGTKATLNGDTSTLIGYDGEIYLKDLKSQNRVDIDLGVAGMCSATFDYDADGEALPRIGPLTCS